MCFIHGISRAELEGKSGETHEKKDERSYDGYRYTWYDSSVRT